LSLLDIWPGEEVHIPIDSVESLSLPVAAGIAMYKLR
jgi:tRNA G18 (ribose-2'-O)-methylase SpoU